MELTVCSPRLFRTNALGYTASDTRGTSGLIKLATRGAPTNIIHKQGEQHTIQRATSTRTPAMSPSIQDPIDTRASPLLRSSPSLATDSATDSTTPSAAATDTTTDFGAARRAQRHYLARSTCPDCFASILHFGIRQHSDAGAPICRPVPVPGLAACRRAAPAGAPRHRAAAAGAARRVNNVAARRLQVLRRWQPSARVLGYRPRGVAVGVPRSAHNGDTLAV